MERFIVISGCSSGGKSTVLAELHRRVGGGDQGETRSHPDCRAIGAAIWPSRSQDAREGLAKIWTRSISQIEPLNEGPMRLHSRVRIIQPKLSPAVWRVTEFSEQEKFVWVSSNPGVKIAAGHYVKPIRGGVLVTLTVEMTGILSAIAGRFTGRLTRKYMSYEAQGLKRICEEGRAA